MRNLPSTLIDISWERVAKIIYIVIPVREAVVMCSIIQPIHAELGGLSRAFQHSVEKKLDLMRLASATPVPSGILNTCEAFGVTRRRTGQMLIRLPNQWPAFAQPPRLVFQTTSTTGNRSLMLKGIKNAVLLNIDKKLARHVICGCSLLLS